MKTALGNFDQIYLINLKRRDDKLRWALAQCSKLGFLPTVVSAFDAIDWQLSSPFLNPAGAIGCTISHLFCLTDAINNDHKRILVLEDDMALMDYFFDDVSNVTGSIPGDADMVWWGWDYWRQPPPVTKQINQHVHRVVNGFVGSQAISYYTKKAIQFAHNQFLTCNKQTKLHNHTDAGGSALADQLNIYCPSRCLISQIRSETDIFKGHNNRNYAMQAENEWKTLKNNPNKLDVIQI